jgi:very-short-patch-repair endonuclease
MRRGFDKREEQFKLIQKNITCFLRKNPTLAERILWQRLRNRKLQGLKFRRQHPIGEYIVDFYCHELRLIIEIDGSIHEQKSESDGERQIDLEQLGYRVLRFGNKEIYQNIQTVLEKIAGS